MKFAVATIFAACVAATEMHHGMGFSGMSFLNGPGDMKKAEELRAKYIREQQMLSMNRRVKVFKFFGARDAEGRARKARAAFHAAMVKAKGLAAAAKALHIKKVAHELAMDKKRASAMTKWLAARNHEKVCLHRGNRATTAYNKAVAARARAVIRENRARSAMKAAWAAHKKSTAAKVAARENYVKWAKAHRKAKGVSKAHKLIAEDKAKRAHNAKKFHEGSVKHHVAAIRRRAAARAAAIRAHMRAQRHAMKAWRFLAQEN